MSDPFCNFYLGQKVVYQPPLEDDAKMRATVRRYAKIGYDFMVPEVGAVYRVRELFWDGGCLRTGVRLVEIYNMPAQFADGYKEPGFWHCYFKPATDISPFEKLLKEANSGKDSDTSRRRREIEIL